MSIRTKQRRRGQPTRERLRSAKDEIAVATVGYRLGTGLRVDWDRLDEQEVWDLLRLTDDLASLDAGQRTDWELLVEKGAGEIGLFARTREEDQIGRKLRALARRARQPARRPCWEEAGAVVLPRQWAFEFVRDRVLWLSHVSLLVYLLSMFESAQTFGTGHFERAADGELVLVIDANFGLVGNVDGDGLIAPRWKQLLAHLERNKFVVVERLGKDWRLRLGPRTLKMQKRRNAAARRAS